MKFSRSVSVAFMLTGLVAATLAWPALSQTSYPPGAKNVVVDTSKFTDGVTTGRLIVDRPTLLSIGVEWMIEGDGNRNAKVDVTYRKKGDAKWLPALPLMRIENEKLGEVTGPSRPAALHPAVIDYTSPNAFAGSVLNLTPDTDYEVHLVLTDPDGVTGDHEKTITVHTRPEPMPATGGHVYHVYPADWTGPKQQPAFTGLLAAYYLGAFDADYWNGYPPRVQPGDIILMHKGVYKDTAFHYYYGHTVNDSNGKPLTAYGTFFDGTYYLHANGTAEKPIVIKAAGDGEVVIDGNGVAVLMDVTRANYNYFEGITFRNATIAMLAGRKAYWGANGLTVKHSRFEDVSRGIHDDWGLSHDYYIADNVFIGRHNPTELRGRTNLFKNDPNFPPPISGPGGSEYAVKVYGQGHVVAYNFARNWHDGFDVATYGNPDATCHDCYGAVDAPRATEEEDLVSAIDFYGNDLTNIDDDCFEMDGSARNVRYFRNRCFNDGSGPFSVDPGFGGPFYWFQNVIYNAVTGNGVGGNNAAGVLYYNNTTFGEMNANAMNEHFANNLFVATGAHTGGLEGGSQDEKLRAVWSVNTMTNYSETDHNGFRPNPGVDPSFLWTSPAKGVQSDFDLTHKGVVQKFATLKDYSAATGQDKHSILVDFSDFKKASAPDHSDFHKLYNADDYDFTLRPSSKAIDAGMVLPTITDGYTGKAPDLGAYESGKPVYHYGPRS